jgi:hypothetical protein
MKQIDNQIPAAPPSSDSGDSATRPVQGSPSLRSLRGNRKSELWGEVAALLARGPVLRDLDDD